MTVSLGNHLRQSATALICAKVYYRGVQRESRSAATDSLAYPSNPI
jgi:hypothetical protein